MGEQVLPEGESSSPWHLRELAGCETGKVPSPVTANRKEPWRSMVATPHPGGGHEADNIYAVLSGIVWRFSKQEELREGRLDSVCPWQERGHRLFSPLFFI